MSINGQNDEEVTDELKEKTGANQDGSTPDEGADSLAQPGSSATGAGTSMGNIDVPDTMDTTGGTTDADVSDGSNQ
jgi:hypothetical protein